MLSHQVLHLHKMFGTRKISKPFRSHLLSKHPANCPCDCSPCVAGDCRPEAVDIPWLHSHFRCPKHPLLHGSEHSYYPWKCVELKCDQCFLNKPVFPKCKCTSCTATSKQAYMYSSRFPVWPCTSGAKKNHK